MEPAPPVWIPVLVVAFAALLAAGIAGIVVRVVSSQDDRPGRVIARAEVGPAGATVPFEGGGRLEVPRRALSVRNTIVVRGLEPHRFSALDGRRVATGRVLSFEPAGLAFERDVRIVLPAPRGGGDVAVVSGNGLRRLEGDYDPVSDMLTIRVRGFDLGGG